MTTKTLVLPNVLTSTATTTTTTINDWFVMNIQQVGYYRVDYSRDIWNDIIIGYKKNYAHFHHVNRELLHEEMFIAWKVLRTEVTAKDCLTLLGVLQYETNGSVWDSADMYMENLNNFLMFSDVYAFFQNFLRNTLSPHINILISSESVADVKLVSAVKKWSTIALHETYLQQELHKLIEFMLANESGDNVDFCSAFRNANESIYLHFMGELKKDVFDINIDIINGLGCSLNAQLLRGFLNEIISSTSELIDWIIVSAFYSTMKSSEIGLETLIEFMNGNYMNVERR
jgi:aminopeptidase N